jgi:hypothetical protein
MNRHILAYLDPTTGSVGYQIALSTVLAAAAAVRMYWKKLRKLFGGSKAESSDRKQLEEKVVNDSRL